MVLQSDLEALAARLTAAGIAASTDPRNVHPPAVLLLPERLEPRTSCKVRAVVRVLVIAPGPGHGDALEWLDSAADKVWAALGRMPLQLTSYDAPATGAPLLAYEGTLNLDLALGKADQ